MKITFIPSDSRVPGLIPEPKPAKDYVPDWFKNTPMFQGNAEPGTKDYRGVSIKGCGPFGDSFLTGYIQETWCDVYVSTDRDMYTCSGRPEVCHVRENEPGMKVIPDYFRREFVWKTPWIPKLPKGWSLLFTHPFNRPELPFWTTTGIVDADVFHHVTWGNYPFYVKKGFNGIIPAGTPMYQMIPIKREDWERDIQSDYPEAERERNRHVTTKKFWGVYRTRFHQKKRYL